MLRQIFRYCKPQNVDFYFRNKVRAINILNVDKDTFFRHNLKSYIHTSIFHENRLYVVDQENIFAYNVILRDPLNIFKIKTPVSDVTTIEEFSEILDQNWRESSIEEVVTTFLRLKNFCVTNNIGISDIRFDKLVDGLMDNCEHISDDELIDLLYCLAEYPKVESYASHNFHDVWSCLDDICCWKIVDWDIDKCFIVANAWYQLHLGKLCDYVYTLIDRNAKKAHQLTKEQLVSIYFYFNVCRKRAVDFEYEFALEQHINDMDTDEMAVVALGYFKTKTKIKLAPIQEALANKVKENSKTIHEISLTAILKVLRYSKPFKVLKTIEEMTEKLHPEIERLSEMCCTHLALLSTGIQTYNKTVFKKVSEKFIEHISHPEKIRSKDIERILNVLTMFNFDPKTNPDIFRACYDEIHKNCRLEELIKYPRSLISSLNYLSLRNMYSYELLDRILDVEYITGAYGKGARLLPREIFSLDCCIDIDCPDYKGNRLPPQLKYKAAKWLTDFTPSYDQWKKLTVADKLVLDAIDTARSIVGDDKYMFIHHILPHFSRADIVLCRDKKTGKFVEPVGFHNYILGDIMLPYNDGSLEWFSIIVLGWNCTVKNTAIPLGHYEMKQRHLKKIGYNPILVIWCEFQTLSPEMKKEYILDKLK